MTLIEITVVMVILSLVGGVIGIKGWQLTRHHRFECAVDAVAAKLSLAAQLALTFEVDLVAQIDQANGGFEMRLTADGELPSTFRALLDRKAVLKEVGEVRYNGSAENQVRLVFGAGASTSPRGELTLTPSYSSDGGRGSTLRLPGYPARIVYENSIPLPPPQVRAPYPEEVLQEKEPGLPAA